LLARSRRRAKAPPAKAIPPWWRACPNVQSRGAAPIYARSLNVSKLYRLTGG
jgi:hypothetical protein